MGTDPHSLSSSILRKLHYKLQNKSSMGKGVSPPILQLFLGFTGLQVYKFTL